METEAPLEAQHLTLSWDGGKTIVVSDVSVQLMAGEMVAMVGRSGCGKTTLLHALSGLTVPLEGKVFAHGKDITGVPGQVSYMLQKDLLLDHLKIIDNVCLPLTVKGVKKAEAREQAAELFGRFGLSGSELSWPSQLSGGMRQRAAFLRTYLMGNDVMLLDEPFSALDPLLRIRMRKEIRSVLDELDIPVVIITHDPDDVEAFADMLVVYSQGRTRQCLDYQPYRLRGVRASDVLVPLVQEVESQALAGA